MKKAPVDQWEFFQNAADEQAAVHRSMIALMVILLLVIFVLFMTRMAFRSWRRLDNYLRESNRKGAGQGSAWELSAKRMNEKPIDQEDDENDEGEGTGDGGGP